MRTSGGGGRLRIRTHAEKGYNLVKVSVFQHISKSGHFLQVVGGVKHFHQEIHLIRSVLRNNLPGNSYHENFCGKLISMYSVYTIINTTNIQYNLL